MGTTPKLALRYPEATDRVADGATAIHNLALDVENQLAPYVGLFASNVTQAIATGVVPIPLNLNVEDEDNQLMHAAGSSPVVTIPAGGDGVYIVSGWASFAASATGNRNVATLKNGVLTPGSSFTIPGQAANTNLIPAGVAVVRLAAGDTVQVAAWQTSGANLNVTSAALRLVRVSA